MLIIYAFAGNKKNIYLGLFVFTSITSNLISNDLVDQLSNLIGGNFQDKVSAYTKDLSMYNEDLTYFVEETRWIIKIQFNFLYYTFISSIIYLWFVTKNKNKMQENFYSFLLLFASYINTIKDLPESGRYIVLFSFIGTIFLILFYSVHYFNKGYHINTIILIAPMLLYGLIRLRSGLDTMSIYLFISNPILYFFHENNESILIYFGK
jgi:hypothetical protein